MQRSYALPSPKRTPNLSVPGLPVLRTPRRRRISYHSLPRPGTYQSVQRLCGRSSSMDAEGKNALYHCTSYQEISSSPRDAVYDTDLTLMRRQTGRQSNRIPARDCTRSSGMEEFRRRAHTQEVRRNSGRIYRLSSLQSAEKSEVISQVGIRAC